MALNKPLCVLWLDPWRFRSSQRPFGMKSPKLSLVDILYQIEARKKHIEKNQCSTLIQSHVAVQTHNQIAIWTQLIVTLITTSYFFTIQNHLGDFDHIWPMSSLEITGDVHLQFHCTIYKAFVLFFLFPVFFAAEKKLQNWGFGPTVDWNSAWVKLGINEGPWPVEAFNFRHQKIHWFTNPDGR